jgi:hypothetical protein
MQFQGDRLKQPRRLFGIMPDLFQGVTILPNWGSIRGGAIGLKILP